MYLQSSWHIFRTSRQIRNVQIISRIYNSQKVSAKVEVTNSDTIHKNVDNTVLLKNENDYLKISNTKGIVTAIPLPETHLENLKNSEFYNIRNAKWREIEVDMSKLGNHYLKLSKFRLSSLVVITSMVGYAMAPAPFELVSFLSCVAGTGLVSSAANSINQFLEIPFDAQMSRTRNRVLVQGHLNPLHAIGFATATSSVGLLILNFGANPLTAALGASNLILYTMIYTPLKRISILNTWVGSIVGAIPPLMGWAASQGTLEAGAFIVGGILYAWQFPHFNALSWNLRPDYAKAGYRMMAVTNPGLCRRTALRYTVCIALCSSLASVTNLTHWTFALLSAPVNLYLVYLGLKFYKQSDSKNSRKLFRYSLLHLPLLLGLMLVTKQSLLKGVETKKEKNTDFPSFENDNVSLVKTFNPSAETSLFNVTV